MTEDDLLAFVAGTLGSIWALDLLTLLKRDPSRRWDRASLVRELRSSPVVIDETLDRLRTAGLIAKDSAGLHRYQTASRELDDMVCELERVYAEKPMAVITAIGTTRPG